MERGASFRLTGRLPSEGGPEAHAILVHPGSVVKYRFDGHHLDPLHRAWSSELLAPTLNRDMVLTLEPA